MYGDNLGGSPNAKRHGQRDRKKPFCRWNTKKCCTKRDTPKRCASTRAGKKREREGRRGGEKKWERKRGAKRERGIGGGERG